MISESELVAAVEPLDADTLRRWVDLGWVLPRRDDVNAHFDTADVARVRLICELHFELRIEEDSMSVVLSLMDQLYSARRALATLVSAVAEQPRDVRKGIAAFVEQQQSS